MRAFLLDWDLPLRAAGLLDLAAAPTFAVLAVASGGGSEMLCLDAAPLSSMRVMYALMCEFNNGQWLRAIGR